MYIIIFKTHDISQYNIFGKMSTYRVLLIIKLIPLIVLYTIKYHKIYLIMYRLTDRLRFKSFFVSDNLSLNSNLTHTLHTNIIYSYSVMTRYIWYLYNCTSVWLTISHLFFTLYKLKRYLPHYVYYRNYLSKVIF